MNLNEICYNKLKEKGLFSDKIYQKRLKWELEEIEAKEKEKYFLNLYSKKIRYIFWKKNL